ncbi:MAG: amino acid ABC transporter substrate-binding protein [Hyphomicrobium sp.]
MCALRDGPNGPCTCKTRGDTAGQFTVVPKSRCRREPKPEAAPGTPAPPTAAPAPLAPAPTETGTTSSPAQATPQPAAVTPVIDPVVTPASPETPAAPATSPPSTETATPAAPETAATAAAVEAAAARPASRLDTIRARGKLLCGVNTSLLGFSSLGSNGTWSGIDADFCRAVAAAVFGDAAKTEFVPIETGQRFASLTSGRVDIVARNTTWTMSRDVEQGVDFAGISYFDGQGFLAREERGLVSAQQLAGLRVCVEVGTTSEANMAFYFKSQKIEVETQTFRNREDMLKAYLDGTCDAYTGDRSALFSDRVSFAEPLKHTVLPEVISKEPLGPLVAQNDREWVEIVRWTLAGLINAEEMGLDQATAASGGAPNDDARRLLEGAAASGEKLRLSRTWLQSVIAATGHYGEMFEANIGKASPIGMDRGMNALWKKGGLLYAPPMW